MRLIKQTGWSGHIIFVEERGKVKFIVENTADVDFIKVGDDIYGSYTVITDSYSFRREHPELCL